MKVKLFYILLTVISAFIIFNGCQQNEITPTSGNLVAGVDEGVYPIIFKEKIVFDTLYKKANIHLKKLTPFEGIAGILNGDYKLFISTRGLNSKQQNFVDSNKIELRTFKFCYDALAVIAPKNSTLNNIRIDELQNLLLGKTSNYKVVIPQTNSGTYQYIMESILKDQPPRNVELVPNDSAVFAKVVGSDNKIGLLSFNTVQDSSKIKFIKVGDFTQEKVDDVYYEPHPGLVIKDYYPFKQTVYVFLNEKGITVASGFATFLTSYEGQKIALSQNLAPAAVPVKINENQ